MYNIASVGFHSFSEESEIGIPFFSLGSSNFLYVAETNNYFNITQFVPIVDLDGISIRPLEINDTFKVGDRCPIPSRTKMFGFTLQDVSFYLENQENFRENEGSLFHLELSAVLGVLNEYNTANIRAVANEYFDNEENGRRWEKIEFTARRASEIYWSSLEQKSQAVPIDETFIEEGIVAASDALLWLRNQNNFHRNAWYEVWKLAQDWFVHKDEICAIAIAWLNYQFIDLSADAAIADAKFIDVLKFTLEFATSKYDLNDIYDILEEITTDHGDIIPLLMRSRASYEKLKHLFTSHGEYDVMERIDRWGYVRGYTT